MGFLNKFGQVVGYIGEGGKALGRGIFLDSPAHAHEQCSATVLDQDTLETWCVEQLLLDAETGDLITPTEAARREEARAGRGAPPLVWDAPSEEWVTPSEAKRRGRRRAQQAPTARADSPEKGSLLVFPDAFDTGSGEWVASDELEERERQRKRVADLIAGSALAGRKLPRLGGAVADGRVKVSGGIAWMGKRGAAEVLAEDGVDLGLLGKIQAVLTGAEKRAAAQRTKTRIVILASMVAVITALTAIALKRG